MKRKKVEDKTIKGRVVIVIGVYGENCGGTRMRVDYNGLINRYTVIGALERVIESLREQAESTEQRKLTLGDVL